MAFRTVLALPLLALSLSVGACASDGRKEAELTQEQVCIAHFENDPVERDRCRVDASVRGDSVPDVLPQQLPLRTGQPSD